MQTTRNIRIAEIALIVILFCVIVLPLLGMLLNIDQRALDYVTQKDVFITALGGSILVTVISTIISIIVAYALAWAVNRTNIKFKSFCKVILVLPMLIPSISHGTGLIMVFGNNGILTNLFGTTSSIYGFTGIVIGSVLYSFPVAFLMISDVLKYQDYSPYAAAKVLGIPERKQFTALTLPFLKKPLISVFFATFTLIVTDYGVPLSVGGQFKTLPVVLYEEAVGQLNYSVGSIIGLVLMVPAVIAFLIDLLNKDTSKGSSVAQSFNIENNKSRDTIAYVICSLVTLFTLMIFVSFGVQAFATRYPSNMAFTFDNFTKTFAKGGLTYLLNSLIIALLTSIIGVTASFVLAYATARIKTSFSKAIHLLTIISLAIPGLVLGLSYVIVFKSTFFYGTIIILIMVNTIHFIASPYLMMYNALGKVHDNLEEVGSIMKIPRGKIIANVIIPQCKYTLIEMFSYFFVNSMMTISAVSFLANMDNKPLSLLINQFEDYGMMECAAVVAIMIFAVNFTLKIIIGAIKKHGEKRNANKETI